MLSCERLRRVFAPYGPIGRNDMVLSTLRNTDGPSHSAHGVVGHYYGSDFPGARTMQSIQLGRFKPTFACRLA
jgi:hypothetical protein